jgi:hypothetical protein
VNPPGAPITDVTIVSQLNNVGVPGEWDEIRVNKEALYDRLRRLPDGEMYTQDYTYVNMIYNCLYVGVGYGSHQELINGLISRII